ncbi:general stress protein CsbD [Rhodocyclus tenuis]|uniref:general stress protein CsbD n=1 Tax=Rhodocyclus tenuis TaxID=1066 RepID=UPI0019087333|nr:general stress protein CsbD [Rhodocyclus tenuis]MBK1681538.1 general stress protein CsbD [Rhodocyclus tenuis]
MSWDFSDESWNTFKPKLKMRWGKLSNAHLDEIGGKREKLLQVIKETYGVSEEEADNQVKSFEAYSKELRPK